MQRSGGGKGGAGSETGSKAKAEGKVGARSETVSKEKAEGKGVPGSETGFKNKAEGKGGAGSETGSKEKAEGTGGGGSETGSKEKEGVKVIDKSGQKTVSKIDAEKVKLDPAEDIESGKQNKEVKNVATETEADRMVEELKDMVTKLSEQLDR